MSDCDFTVCESLVYSGSYKEAFNCFTDLLHTKDFSNEVTSNIYNYLGVLITIEPSLSKDEDESGLIFYLQAIEFNKENTDAWLNIAGSFGKTQPVDHNNVDAFLDAMTYLLSVFNKLNVNEKVTVNNKLKEYEELFQLKLNKHDKSI